MTSAHDVIQIDLFGTGTMKIASAVHTMEFVSEVDCESFFRAYPFTTIPFCFCLAHTYNITFLMRKVKRLF